MEDGLFVVDGDVDGAEVTTTILGNNCKLGFLRPHFHDLTGSGGTEIASI